MSRQDFSSGPEPTSTRDDLDRRPSLLLNQNDPELQALMKGKIVQKRGRRGSVSAEAYKHDAKFKAPDYNHSDHDIQRLFESTRTNILFQALSEEEKRNIFGAMERIEVRSGKKLIQEGAAGDFFYVFQSGTYDVFKEESGRIPVYTYNSGGSFGELALMYNCPRAATVEARSDGIVFRMNRHTFKQMLVGMQQGAAQHISSLRADFKQRSRSVSAAVKKASLKNDAPLDFSSPPFHGGIALQSYGREAAIGRAANLEEEPAHIRLYNRPIGLSRGSSRAGRSGGEDPADNVESQSAWASPPANASRSGMAFGHRFRVARQPGPQAMSNYLKGYRNVSGAPDELPLRIVTHSISGTAQKRNPESTHRGRIRNASGGFYNA